jgi:hypothetical protein
MPKRKRGHGGVDQNDPAAQLAAKRQAVEKKLFHGKTVLGRVLKNAKTLLVLKLQRKLGTNSKGNPNEEAKVGAEIETLKVGFNLKVDDGWESC